MVVPKAAPCVTISSLCVPTSRAAAGGGPRIRSPSGSPQSTSELATADALNELKLLQERRDLQTELESKSAVTDHAALEEAFVKVARSYSERQGISYTTWREIGVDAAVLAKPASPAAAEFAIRQRIASRASNTTSTLPSARSRSKAESNAAASRQTSGSSSSSDGSPRRPPTTAGRRAARCDRRRHETAPPATSASSTGWLNTRPRLDHRFARMRSPSTSR